MRFSAWRSKSKLPVASAEPSDIDDASQHLRRLHVGVGDARPRLIDDEIDALAAGRGEHGVGQAGSLE